MSRLKDFKNKIDTFILKFTIQICAELYFYPATILKDKKGENLEFNAIKGKSDVMPVWQENFELSVTLMNIEINC